MTELSIKLRWNDPNRIEQGHKIYRSDTPMDVNNMPEPIALLDKNITMYEDFNVIEDQFYYYIVGAFNDIIGEEYFSNEIYVEAKAFPYLTDDMIFYIDANMPDSYNVGVPDNWYDISPVGGTVELYGATKIDSGIYFDGVNDHGKIFRDDLNGGTFAYDVITVNFWYKPPTTGNTVSSERANVITVEDSFEISIGSNNGSTLSISYATVPWQWRTATNVLSNDGWQMITFVHSHNYRKIYINASEVYNSNETGGITKGNPAYPFLALMKRHINSTTYNEGSLGAMLIYSKVLLPDDITVMFSDSKSQYGL